MYNVIQDVTKKAITSFITDYKMILIIFVIFSITGFIAIVVGDDNGLIEGIIGGLIVGLLFTIAALIVLKQIFKI